MLDDKELDALAHRADNLEEANTNHNHQLENLLGDHRHLIEAYSTLKHDYDEEIRARTQLPKGPERKQLVLVIIDGNAYIFQDDLLQRGNEGGREAAQLLLANVRRSLKTSGGPSGCRVVVHMFMNVWDVSRKLAKHKLCGAEARSLGRFIAGFNEANDSFHIIDVGENRDSPMRNPKVRSTFETYAGTSLCGRIIFAGCNDRQLVDMFSPYRNRADKLTLVKSAAWALAFEELGLPIEEYNDVFRTTPLETPVIAKSTSSRDSSISAPPSRMANSSTTTLAWRQASSADEVSSPTSETMPSNRPTAKHRGKPPPPSKPFSNELAAKLPVVTPDNAHLIPVNRFLQRLDTHIPRPTSKDFTAYHERSRGWKICNDHHLSLRCRSGSSCRYDHSEISEAERLCLQHYVRELPCPRGTKCHLRGCYLGHICIKANCKGGSGCRLTADMHHRELELDEWIKPNRMAQGAEGDSSDGDANWYKNPAKTAMKTNKTWQGKDQRRETAAYTERRHASKTNANANDTGDDNSWGDSGAWCDSPVDRYGHSGSEDLIDLSDPSEAEATTAHKENDDAHDTENQERASVDSVEPADAALSDTESWLRD